MRSVLWPSLGYGWDGVRARAARAAVKVGVGGGAEDSRKENNKQNSRRVQIK